MIIELDTKILDEFPGLSMNQLYDTTVEGRKINYRYYISEAKKIVADFTEQQLELFSI